MYLNQQKTKRSARHAALRCGVRSATPRSGFVLILVIVMLGLLAIVGVSFTQFATQEVQSATARDGAFAHHEEQAAVEQQLDEGLASVLVGSNNLQDFTHGHEILRDLYGGDGQKVRVRLHSQPDNNKATTRLVLETDLTAEVPYGLCPLPGYYSGRQMVFSSGRFKGTSVRITNSDYFNAKNNMLVILVDVDTGFDYDDTEFTVPFDWINAIQVGDAVIIGRPFNGGGMGVYPQGGEHFNDAWLDDGVVDDAVSIPNARASFSVFPTSGHPVQSDGIADMFTPNFFYSGLRPESVWVPEKINNDEDTIVRLVPYGGFDEDYDYPDFQNMFLGLVRHRMQNLDNGEGWQPTAVVEQPSFHRPGMIERMRIPGVFTPTGIDPWRHPLGRKMMLRPRPVDQRLPGKNGFYGNPITLIEGNGDPWDDIPHPGVDGVFGTFDDLHPGADGTYDGVDGNGIPLGDDRFFTEGFPAPFYRTNLNLNGNDILDCLEDVDNDGVMDGYRLPATLFRPGRWMLDVDNDGDGMADGVWVDLGKPVRTTTDGRRVKPLYSFLIVDLDSRLNLNVHGQLNRDQFNNVNGALPTNPVDTVADQFADSHLSVHPGVNPTFAIDDLPVGSGWSVAEINLQNVFRQDATGERSPANLEYLQVLAGKVGNPYAQPPRPIVKGRYGEYAMLMDSDNTGLPQDTDQDQRPNYPGPGYTQNYNSINDNFRWDDDRPGHWLTRLQYMAATDTDPLNTSRFHGDYFEGTVVWQSNDVLSAPTFIPRWYRNPPDFDGDGIVTLAEGAGLMLGWPRYGPSFDEFTASIQKEWGWGGHLTGTVFEDDRGWGWDPIRQTPNDLTLQPYQLWNPGEWGNENTNEADEVNMIDRRGASDALYGAEDLTWLNVAHDLSGSELVSRLSELAPFTFGTATPPKAAVPFSTLINPTAARNRRLVTTDSWDLADFSAPPASGSDWLPANWGEGQLAPIFRPGQGSGTLGFGKTVGLFIGTESTDEQLAIRSFFQLIPDEVKAGFRFDLNRPFGDGIDNNGNGVIDEDLEAGIDNFDNDGDGFADETYGDLPGNVQSGKGIPDGVDNDGNGLIDDALELIEDIRGRDRKIRTVNDNVPGPRQRFARDLYILLYLVAMDPGSDDKIGTLDDTPRFVVPPGFIIDYTDFNTRFGTLLEPVPAPAIISAGAADYLAQLAVNIVDFRDADSIMTGFEYDRWPGIRGELPDQTFAEGTWTVNGNLAHDYLLADEDDGSGTEPSVLEQQNPGAGGIVWGVERPNVVINETLSFYDTRDEEEIDDELAGAPNTTYDQSYVWVELYNPTNPNQPGYPPVDLSELAPRGADAQDLTDEVWRLVISQEAGPLPMVTREIQENNVGLGWSPAAWGDPDGSGKPELSYNSASPLAGKPVKVVFGVTGPKSYANQIIPNAAFPVTTPSLGSAKWGAIPIRPGIPPVDQFKLAGNEYMSVGSLQLVGTGSLLEGGGLPRTDYGITQETGAQTHLDTGIPNNSYGPNSIPLRGAYLQRLADPTRNWHKQANPYVTIDAMQVKTYVLDTTDKDEGGGFKAESGLASLERMMPFVGRAREVPDSESSFITPSYPQYGSPASPDGAKTYLQQSFESMGNSMGIINEHTKSYYGSYRFPWFAFYDRMFASPTELMHVPGTRPERLTNEFSTLMAWQPALAGANAESDFYSPTTNLQSGLFDPTRPPKPFPHLVQWLESHQKPAQNQSKLQEGQEGVVPTTGLYRFLEFVEVPSRFSGVNQSNNATPPNHYRRGRRVPGKINLNTVYEPEVFKALFNNHPGVRDTTGHELWDDLKAGQGVLNPSLSGSDIRRDGWEYYTSQTGILQKPVAWGTEFDRPFRSYAFGASPLGDVNDTFLRRLLYGQQTPPESSPLFDWLAFATLPPQWPGVLTPKQHTPFRFQLLQKLGNGATTRSNVFAIWVTVGYFEVLSEPQKDGLDNDMDVIVNNNGNSVVIPYADEPDELLPRLGQELGRQTGDETRHRAFYVIDRTRSSGWHPDLEIDPSEMILVRKMIE